MPISYCIIGVCSKIVGKLIVLKLADMVPFPTNIIIQGEKIANMWGWWGRGACKYPKLCLAPPSLLLLTGQMQFPVKTYNFSQQFMIFYHNRLANEPIGTKYIILQNKNKFFGVNK